MLRGNGFLLHPDVRTFSITNELVTMDEPTSGDQEGLEISVSGRELRLFAILEGRVSEVYRSAASCTTGRRRRRA